MTGIEWFIFSVSIMAVVAILWAAAGNPKNAYYFFRYSKAGKSVLLGIILFIALGTASAWLSRAFSTPLGVTYLNYGEVFLGLDNTFKQSPQCNDDASDQFNFGSKTLTSNGGFRFNLLRSTDKKFELNTQYTHHSCAFNTDRNGYDAIGLEATYKLWGR